MKTRPNIVLERDISIDIIKVIAIIGVVIIHTCRFDVPVLSPDWLSSLFWRSVCGAGVPLFLMASGAIMLDEAKELSIKKLYLKNILRIIIAMFVWGIVYKIYHLLKADTFSIVTLIGAVKEVLFFNQEFHFYYLHMILIVYAFLPITRVFINSASQTQLKYALLLWFVLAIVYPALLAFGPFNRLGGITNQWGINLTYASIGFGILGYYLKKYPLARAKALILLICGLLLTFGLTLYKSRDIGMLYENFLNGNSVPIYLLSVGIFGLVKDININSEKLKNTVSWLSKSSFCIYLVHMLIMYLMKEIGMNIDFAPYIISIPLFAFLLLALSITFYFVLSKIPFVKKWLI